MFPHSTKKGFKRALQRSVDSSHAQESVMAWVFPSSRSTRPCQESSRLFGSELPLDSQQRHNARKELCGVRRLRAGASAAAQEGGWRLLRHQSEGYWWERRGHVCESGQHPRSSIDESSISSQLQDSPCSVLKGLNVSVLHKNWENLHLSKHGKRLHAYTKPVRLEDRDFSVLQYQCQLQNEFLLEQQTEVLRTSHPPPVSHLLCCPDWPRSS